MGRRYIIVDDFPVIHLYLTDARIWKVSAGTIGISIETCQSQYQQEQFFHGVVLLIFLRVLRGIKLNPRCCQIAYGLPQVGIIIFKIFNAVGIGIGS